MYQAVGEVSRHTPQWLYSSGELCMVESKSPQSGRKMKIRLICVGRD